jgi:hypothetical protein
MPTFEIVNRASHKEKKNAHGMELDSSSTGNNTIDHDSLYTRTEKNPKEK